MSKEKRNGMDRRQFIQTTSTLAAAAGAAGVFLKTRPASAAGVPAVDRTGVPDKLETDTTNVDVKYTVCLNCHSGCGLKVRVSKGSNPTVLKIDGNPFHPNCIDDDEGRIEMGSTGDLAAALKKSGTTCPKGQASLEILYNPYRILTPLKRQDARGGGKWKAITWTTAIAEIAAAVLPYWTRGPDPTYTGSKTSMLINQSNPSLGYKNNQVLMSIGRLEHGQKEFTDRWCKTGFGTQNYRLEPGAAEEARPPPLHRSCNTARPLYGGPDPALLQAGQAENLPPPPQRSRPQRGTLPTIAGGQGET